MNFKLIINHKKNLQKSNFIRHFIPRKRSKSIFFSVFYVENPQVSLRKQSMQK